MVEYEYREMSSDSLLPDYPRFSFPEGTLVLGYDYYQGWNGDVIRLRVLIPVSDAKEDQP